MQPQTTLSTLIQKFVSYPKQYRAQITERLNTTHWRVFKTYIAGASHRQPVIQKLNDAGLANIELRCEAEPQNPHDVYAIRIEGKRSTDTNWEPVGFVPKGLNVEVFYAAVHNQLDVYPVSIGKGKTSPNIGLVIALLNRFDPMDDPAQLPHQESLSEYDREQDLQRKPAQQ